MNIKETPVLLLTGYLGSGKTTLVNKILANKKGIKFAVIVNDIGEVNIDADLIEASGICEPAPIAQTICAYPQMYPDLAKKGKAVLDSIVTVVDARRMCDEFSAGNDLLKKDLQEDDIENLLIQQIEFCNIILLNKVDDVSKEELGLVKKIIRSLQPKAEIIECNYGDVDLDKILNTGDFNFDKVATSASWIAEIEGHDDEEDEHEHHHDHDEHEHHHDEHDEHHHEHHEHHHHHHCHHHHGLENEESGEALEYNIQTFVYYARRPFDINFFDDFVARQWPKQIIRCKGLCYFSNEKDICYVFEQAGKQVSLRNAGQWYATMPPFQLREFLENNPKLKKDWEEPYGDRMQKLVFIGQDLDKEAITKALDTCLTDF